MIFLDIRDRVGLAQVVFDPDRAETFAAADRVRSEYVVKITGKVRLRTDGAGNNARARLCSDCFRSASVGFIAACQILFRACLEVCFVPACTAEAKAWHGQHFLQFRCLTGRTINQRWSADLLNGFQLMTTGSTLVIAQYL